MGEKKLLTMREAAAQAIDALSSAQRNRFSEDSEIRSSAIREELERRRRERHKREKTNA